MAPGLLFLSIHMPQLPIQKTRTIPVKCREDIMRHYCESTPCAVSEGEWDTMEDTGKSMMRALYILLVCGMPKGTCWAEAMLNSEINQARSLSVIELCLSEGISQSVENSTKYIFF